ncbi:G patch domain-containing protein 4 [Austrofundulus limnaeus]|uniref:G patch domain-containing protein 4 n=1 Tax=Austrofundulus limnaeus TaxID=52670 RepID=A0A2I4CZJ6_AUSLI|nr:PREDICTED: G patch domain-containing protein 4-like [Austrofundulus limnaeus]XP_013885421.1 PREDICTED: G patch domain-containing protein 4-like [Austrofundulus limnaeus]
MAEVVPEKSRGLKFAEQQLLRHGWEQGKGLGRAENGISEPVKVKVKCDKGGVGHKEGEQFSFHWWDHVFNKASASLQVETDQNGIKLKKTAEEGEEDGTISNRKPRKALLAKSKLYGCFVKSATLLSGQEQPEPKSSVSDSSSSSEEEEEQKLDLSSTTKLSDSELMKVCGGRTAHKGARHGLTMSAKLARLEQQEAEFMAKYGKKSQHTPSSSVCVEQTPPTVGSEPTEEPRRQKTKKKRSTERCKELNEEEECESTETDIKPKKKKKKDQTKDRLPAEGDRNCRISEGAAEFNSDSKRKKNRKSLKNYAKTPEEEGESVQSGDRTQEEAELTESQKRKKSKKDKLLTEKSDEDLFPPKKKKKSKLTTN